MAGNSIGADKKFLEKYMPQFMSHLHYRVVDVSTIKELCRFVSSMWHLSFVYYPDYVAMSAFVVGMSIALSSA